MFKGYFRSCFLKRTSSERFSGAIEELSFNYSNSCAFLSLPKVNKSYSTWITLLNMFVKWQRYKSYLKSLLMDSSSRHGSWKWRLLRNDRVCELFTSSSNITATRTVSSNPWDLLNTLVSIGFSRSYWQIKQLHGGGLLEGWTATFVVQDIDKTLFTKHF